MNKHHFSLITGRCVYEPEPEPEVTHHERVTVQEGGKNVHAGFLAKLTDGRFNAYSPYDFTPHVVDEGGMSFRREGDARWYLTLCTLTRGMQA